MHDQCGVLISSILLMSFIGIVGIVMYGEHPNIQTLQDGLGTNSQIKVCFIEIL